MSKDRLADLLWGEAPPLNIAATLETYVSHVRRHVGSARKDGWVVTEPGAYRIDAARVATDLDEFDQLAARGTRAAVEQALALVRGDVLADEPYGSWALRLREQYRVRHLEALVLAAEQARAAGDNAAAAARAEQAIEVDAVCERAHRAYMAALRALGRVDDAVRAFQRCRQVLHDELGLEPDPDTIALRDAIAHPEREPARAARAPLGRPRAPARELPFLGRGSELDHLERAARAALRGAPALLLVEGEAGIGKSRLIEELTARLAGTRIAATKCFPLDLAVPFVPVAALARQLAPRETLADAGRYPQLGEIVPELGVHTAAGEGARARALESLVELVRAAGPTLLVVDDLHWADASSLGALDYLARRGGDGCFAILGSFRGEEAGAEHPVRRLGAQAVLELAPLSAADLGILGEESQRWHERTGGNALYLTEGLRAAADGAAPPSSLRDVILGRSQAAGAFGHRVLVIAALLGRAFEAEVVADLAGEPTEAVEEALERLCERRLLCAAGARFDFRHDLVRETLAGSMSPSRRRRLLARAVELLEARGAAPAELAAHADQAGQPERAVRYATAAGDAALARFANVEAQAHYARAVRLVEAHPEMVEPGTLELLLLRQAAALTPLRRCAEADALARRALEQAERRGDQRRVLDALETLTRASQFGASEPAGALTWARRALAVAEALGDAASLTRVHALMAGPTATLGMLDDAIHYAEKAIASAGAAARPASAFAMARLALVLRVRARHAEAIDWTRRAEAAALAQRDEQSLLMARWIRALTLQELGRCAEAWQALASMDEVGRGEEGFWHGRVPNTWGSFYADLGLYERALERDLESLDNARRGGSPLVKEAEIQTVLNLAADRLALGRLDAARTDIEWTRRQSCTYARFRWMARLHAIDAELAVAEGDAERARSAADACLAMAGKYDQPKNEVRGRLAAARALAALGRRADARKQAAAAARLADERGLRHLAWRAWQAAGDPARAGESIRAIAGALDEPLRTAFLRASPP